jgi:hypothetical protein
VANRYVGNFNRHAIASTLPSANSRCLYHRIRKPCKDKNSFGWVRSQ